MKLTKNVSFDKLSIFIVFIMIYVSTETLLFGTNKSVFFSFFHYFILLLLFVYLFILHFNKYKRIVFDKNIFLIFGLLVILSMITMLFNNDISFHYFYEILLLCIALLYTSIFSFDNFKSSYVKIVSFLVKVSFFTFFLDLFFPSVLNYFPTIINKSNIKFHFWPLGGAMFKTLYVSVKNWGIFREPGVFSVFILLAIIFVFLDNKKINIKQLLLLFIGLLSTFSTAGIISGILLIILYIFKDKLSLCKFFVIFTFVFIFFILFSNTNFYQIVFGKLFTQNSSLISRTASIYSNFKIFLNSPLFGVGFGKLDPLFQYYTVELFNVFVSNTYANTNTFLRMLSTHGIIFFLIYFIGYFKFFIKNYNNIFFSLLFFIILLLGFSNENLMLNVIFPIILFFGYKNAYNV